MITEIIPDRNQPMFTIGDKVFCEQLDNVLHTVRKVRTITGWSATEPFIGNVFLFYLDHENVAVLESSLELVR